MKPKRNVYQFSNFISSLRLCSICRRIEANGLGVFALHFPAAGTRFFLILISRASTKIRKRAQTMPASGLESYGIEKKIRLKINTFTEMLKPLAFGSA